MPYTYNRDFSFDGSAPGKIDKAIFGKDPDRNRIAVALSISLSDGSAKFLFFDVVDLEKMLVDAKVNYVNELACIPIISNKTDGTITDVRRMREVR